MRKLSAVTCLLALMCSILSSCGSGGGEFADGVYTVEVSLSGGSGRAGVESPAKLVIEGDTITATVVWSSHFYEFMLVDGVKYEPVQAEGNSTFEIPVTLDTDMDVSAQTVAMSQPHLIDYTLRFDSSTVREAEA